MHSDVQRQETAINAPALTTVSPLERKVDILLAHYGQSHQNPRNGAIHYVAIQLIVLSLCGLLFALSKLLGKLGIAW
jgi:Protein of unknown function (DUF962)